MSPEAVYDGPTIVAEGLRVGFPGDGKPVIATNGVTLTVDPGRTLGIVGETGSGKSVTLRALCGLVPPPGRLLGGTITVQGQRCATAQELAGLRGTVVSMIFQDPSATLNPVRRIGDQLCEVLRAKVGLRRADAKAEAVALLDRVGIPRPARRMAAYAHELSGGMRQRVMIALAIATRPRLLLADEPTTALDVTTQERILALLAELQRDNGMAMIFVTHDLGVVRDICDEVLVMYGGYVVERGPASLLTESPMHPYTKGLLAAVPQLYGHLVSAPIPGQPIDMADLPTGCPFAPRCPSARPDCSLIDMTHEVTEPRCACPFARAGSISDEVSAAQVSTCSR